VNKFGLLYEEEEGGSLTDRLATFPAVRPRAAVDLAAMDAVAAQHGFTSREGGGTEPSRPLGRRRRAIPSEPTRHLAIRLTSSGYERFVAFADRQKLTYHEALLQLMDRAGE
jgi:hypothetical protein